MYERATAFEIKEDNFPLTSSSLVHVAEARVTNVVPDLVKLKRSPSFFSLSLSLSLSSNRSTINPFGTNDDYI